MTLDELIARLRAIREKVSGSTPVFIGEDDLGWDANTVAVLTADQLMNEYGIEQEGGEAVVIQG